LKAPLRQRPGFAWCLVALVLLAGSLLAQGPAAHAVLEWQPARALDEPWRAWSAAFVHYSRLHLIGNLAGLALTAAFGWVSRVPTSAAVAWCLAWPLTHLLFLGLAPDLRHYGGLSGVVHAGVAIGLVHLFITGTRGQRLVASALLAGLIAKIVSETPWRGAVQQLDGWDIAIAPMAHVSGALAGTLVALLVHALRRAISSSQETHA
jgi:rhomboid family GlyGly-CTERM serine protease